MNGDVIDVLEDFVARGDLWSSEQVDHLVGWLRAATDATGDPNPALLARALSAVSAYRAQGPVAPRTASEVEAIVYPRMWKVMEAARGGLPAGEVRTRIGVLDRRLGARLAEERRP